jgi:hypothetical protein
MDNQVVITRMSNGLKRIKTFKNKKDAINFFVQWCDERDYDFDETYHAGGIGHDYRIELVN